MKKLLYLLIASSILIAIIFIVAGLLLHCLPLVMSGIAIAVVAAVVYKALDY